jgi:GH15 family glucan-1,4-alpha-glucosidase
MASSVRRIEDYALIGDRETAALVSRHGSIDWLCLPRFDSPACFASLLGDERNGFWSLRPAGEVRSARRSYRDGTLVLETEYETDEGAARVTDCMAARDRCPRLVRMVEGLRGEVTMDLDLVLRFDYGSVVPWVRKATGGLLAIAGPDAVRIQSDVPLHNENMRSHARFTVAKGQRRSFVLEWHDAFSRQPREHVDVPGLVRGTTAWWKKWSARAAYEGPHRDAVVRSLVTLKALTYAPTGAIVSAPTTSLPEVPGGSRNWDYRYCWLRDATFTLYAMVNSGYREEAAAWRDWLLRAIAGSADQVQAVYGVRGERRVEEIPLPWLPGFNGARPVRTGNAVQGQTQLDIFGELADALFLGERSGFEGPEEAQPLHTRLTEHLERVWREPDSGMWELRGPRRDYTHSKVMAWVAFDRSVEMIESMRLDGPLERWRAVRDPIRAWRRRCAPSRASCSSMASFAGSGRKPRTRVLARAASFPAASGWPTCTFWRAGAPRLPRSSSGSSAWRTTWGCSPRNTIPATGECSATSRKRSPMWLS